MSFNRKAARRLGGPLTFAVIAAGAAAVGVSVFSGVSSSGQRPAAAASQTASTDQKPAPPPLPAPKSGSADPVPLDPVSEGPLPTPTHVGQVLVGAGVGVVQLPYDHRSFATTSFYEFPPTTVYTDIAAGNLTSTPDQGVLRVVVMDPYGSNTDLDYDAPTATGALTITSVQGNLINLVSSAGDTYQFDLTTRAFG